MRTFGIIVAGSPGSGKTLTAVSFHPAGVTTTNRLVIDMEARVSSYRAEEYGIVDGKDAPEQLLYSCEVYPQFPDQINAQQFIDLFESIKSGKRHPDVIVIDNIVLFQTEFSGWCQEKTTAIKLAEVAGVKAKFKMVLEYNFHVGDPNWWNLMKAILKEFLLELRRKSIHFIGTTELKNVWENYGVKGKQKILGKSVSVWDCWLQLCDATWNLNRMGKNNKLTLKPQVELDRFAPKSSIVGIPPSFRWESWDQIWAWEKSRHITSQEQLDTLQPPEVGYPDAAENGVPVEVSPLASEDPPQNEPPYEGKLNWGEVMTRAAAISKAAVDKAKKLRAAGKNEQQTLAEVVAMARKDGAEKK